MKNTYADGISDHSLFSGIELTIDSPVKWLEKHVMLNDQLRNSCGDAAFALGMDDFKTYVETAKL
jgi:sialic acid synthase SpsE